MDFTGGRAGRFSSGPALDGERRFTVDVEWEDLLAAFLSTRTNEESYLDRETGEVISLSESEDEDEGDREGDGVEGDGFAGGEEENIREEMENDPDRFILVSPVPQNDRVEWMGAFVQTVKAKELSRQLLQAARSHNPEREFERVLRKDLPERARWIGFLESQVQEIIEGWIEENDVESEMPPPWKLKVPRRRASKKVGDGD
jgi:hypothetical protein